MKSVFVVLKSDPIDILEHHKYVVIKDECEVFEKDVHIRLFKRMNNLKRLTKTVMEPTHIVFGFNI